MSNKNIDFFNMHLNSLPILKNKNIFFLGKSNIIK